MIGRQNFITEKRLGNVLIQGFGQSNWVGPLNIPVPSAPYRKEFNNVDYHGAPLQYGVNYDGSNFGIDLALAKEFNERFQNSNLWYQKEAVSGTGYPYWLQTANLDRLKASYSALLARTAALENKTKIFICLLNTNPSVNYAEANSVKDDFNTIVTALETSGEPFDHIIICYTGEIEATEYDYLVRTKYREWIGENSERASGFDLAQYEFFDGIHFNEPSTYLAGRNLMSHIQGLF